MPMSYGSIPVRRVVREGARSPLGQNSPQPPCEQLDPRKVPTEANGMGGERTNGNATLRRAGDLMPAVLSIRHSRRYPQIPWPKRTGNRSQRKLAELEFSHTVLFMKELVFEVTQEADGGYVAEALGEGIVTQADSWEDLRTNVKEAVTAYFFDRESPVSLRLHLVRDEVLTA